MKITRARFDRVSMYYPSIHLFANWYLVRSKSRKFFTLIWLVVKVIPDKEYSYPVKMEGKE